MTREFTSAREVSEEFQKKGLPADFCHVPFVSLIFEPDGRVGSCRMKGTEFPVGNLHSQSIEEIWNGPILRQWRREFLTGKVEMCRQEVRHDRCHTCPEYNTLLPEARLEELQARKPLRIALNLNGKCNLQCRMCHIYREPNGLYDQRGWLEQVKPWAEAAREIELLSGEPFIQRDTYRWIEHLAEKNPDCRWSITTNGHWKLTDTVRAALDRIKFKHLIVSIDSLDSETYPKIRCGGSLSVVLANLDRLIEYDRTRVARGLGSLEIRVAFLVQQDNWRELGDFHEFGKRKGVEVFRSFLYEPAELSLLALPAAEREAILAHYLTHLTREQLLSSRRVFLPLLDSLEPLARAEGLLGLQKRISESSQSLTPPAGMLPI